MKQCGGVQDQKNQGDSFSFTRPLRSLLRPSEASHGPKCIHSIVNNTVRKTELGILARSARVPGQENVSIAEEFHAVTSLSCDWLLLSRHGVKLDVWMFRL